MIHRICDKCGKMESVDFMVKVDDDIFCIECNEEEKCDKSATKVRQKCDESATIK